MTQARTASTDRDVVLITTEDGRAMAAEQPSFNNGMEMLFITEQGAVNEVIKLPMFYRGMYVV